MAIRVGKDGSVKLGTAAVVGMGTWQMDGITTEEFDASDFGDQWKTYLYGMKDGGTVSFNGHFDPSDTTGQEALRQANALNTALTDLRFYIDNTSYLVPNQTAGYFSPTLTTGAGTPVSSVNVTQLNIGMDKSGLGTISFTVKVNGCMALI